MAITNSRHEVGGVVAVTTRCERTTPSPAVGHHGPGNVPMWSSAGIRRIRRQSHGGTPILSISFVRASGTGMAQQVLVSEMAQKWSPIWFSLVDEFKRVKKRVLAGSQGR